MKKILFVFLISFFFISGCWTEGNIENNWDNEGSLKTSDILSMQEKCHNHLKEIKENDDIDTNIYYSPVLNTCIQDEFSIWKWDDLWDMAWTIERVLKDFYKQKVIFSCVMYPTWKKMKDGFIYEDKYFDEDTLSLFEMYWDWEWECNHLYDWASEYLQG